MTSNIDPDRPNVGVPRLTKDGFEDNFTAAKDEIEDLQSRVTVLEGGGGGFTIDQYDIAARLTSGSGGIEAVDIAALTDETSPASADALLAKRDSDGVLIQIGVGNIPGGEVASVFTRTGAVIAASGDYDDAEVTSAASATNYTPGSATVDGHLSGIDTALGTVGAVASVFTRTGAVVAVSGDYDADEITETASNKIMTSAERTKLSGIETSATADQTNAEIKTAYEANADTNEFSDAEQTKLSGVATGATDDTTVDAHIADAVAAHAGTAISNTPAGGIAATTVQAAIDELDSEKTDDTTVDAHIADAVAAHDDSAIAAAASATNYTPGASTVEGHLSGIDTALGTVGAVASVFSRTGVVVAVAGDYDDAEVTAAASATNYTPGAATVEGHLSGIDTALGTVGAVASVFSRTGVVVAVTGDYTASEVTNVAAGDIAATTVQAAIDELDSEKAATAHNHTLADVTDSGALAALATVGTTEIDDNAVTLAKIAGGTANRLLGHDGSGDPSEITIAGDAALSAGTLTVTTEVSTDITPVLGGDLTMSGNALVTTSNADVLLSPNGTGAVSVSEVTNYENNVTVDDDIPNKKFCDDTYLKQTESFIIAASDETTALTTGTAKTTFRMPYAFTLTEVRASVTTAPTGSVLTVDINEGGTTILSTKITIDATELTSETAATAPVISDTALADDAEITLDIDTIGSTVAGAGLKVTLIGNQA